MKPLLVAAAFGAILVPAAASADPVTRTVTIDTPRYDGTRTTTRDRDAGTVTREGTLTRESDGATASRSYSRARTDDGVTASGSATNFNGQTRGFDYSRQRTDNGYRAQGSATGFNGQSYSLNAGGRRTADGGFVRGRAIRNGDGQLVAGSRVAVRRGPDGGFHRRAGRFRR